MFRAGLSALPFLLPLLFQTVFGMSAFSSGMLTFATAVGSIGMKASTPPILRRFGFRKVLIWNCILTVLSVLLCLTFTPATPPLVIFIILLISGFFQSLEFSSLNSIPYADIPSHQMSSATSLAQLMQQVGKAVGIATAAVTLQLTLAWRGGGQLTTVEFLYGFGVVVVFALASLPVYVAMSPDAGAELSGYRNRGAGVPSKAQNSPSASRAESQVRDRAS